MISEKTISKKELKALRKKVEELWVGWGDDVNNIDNDEYHPCIEDGYLCVDVCTKDGESMVDLKFDRKTMEVID
jgi:hypothetical protein